MTLSFTFKNKIKEEEIKIESLCPSMSFLAGD